MSKEPRITRLTWGAIREAKFLTGDKVLVTIYGRTERDASHEIHVTLDVGQIPWSIRRLWSAFFTWRRMQREKIERMERSMKGAAEIGEKEGEQE